MLSDWADWAADDDYELLPPSKQTVQLTDNMREEIAQFVIANCDHDLPEITVLEAMRCVPRDGVKWGKLTINGERITASWAYHSERYQRRANYIRVRFSYHQIHAIVANTCMLTIVFDNSITSFYLGKMYSDRRFTTAASTRYGRCKCRPFQTSNYIAPMEKSRRSL